MSGPIIERYNWLTPCLCVWCIGAVAATPPLFAAVALKDSTVIWHTNNYSISQDYGLISAQANTSVAKSFNCKVIDNEYLKIILETDFGCRIVSMVYKPTNHEQLQLHYEQDKLQRNDGSIGDSIGPAFLHVAWETGDDYECRKLPCGRTAFFGSRTRNVCGGNDG